LTKIRRQRDPAYRHAVSLLAQGHTEYAFDTFEQLGAIREDRNALRLFAAAAEDYVASVRAGQSCLAISPVWSEINTFTEEVRLRLRAQDVLRDDDHRTTVIMPMQWTREDKRRIANYRCGDMLSFFRAQADIPKGALGSVVGRESDALIVRTADGRDHRLNPKAATGFEVGLPREIGVAAGDRLLIRANHKPADLQNGDIVMVKSLRADDAIELVDGRSIPPDFRLFTHGYATTSHAAQGKTVDRGILLMGDDGIAAANLKQAYVSNSRFRCSQVIYTTDKKAAREAMRRSGDRTLVSEVLPPEHGAEHSSPPTLIDRVRRGVPDARASFRWPRWTRAARRPARAAARV
jgi:hypothetical protein